MIDKFSKIEFKSARIRKINATGKELMFQMALDSKINLARANRELHGFGIPFIVSICLGFIRWILKSSI